MKRSVLLAALFFICMSSARAQYSINENKVWAFGFGGGLDFTSGVPVPFVSAMATNEGCASVSDPRGNLLFYTNGSKVYNRTGAVMPSGSAIAPFTTISCSQAAVIVPVMGDTNQYYIFSLEDGSYPLVPSRLAYSIVDMRLDGGMGDVPVGTRGIILDSFLSEHMAIVPGNACNVWVITHKKLVMDFVVRNVTASGIGAPITSTVGTFTGGTYVNIYGILACSPDHRKLAMATGSSLPNGTELYDFDPLTGIVSNRRVLDSVNSYYGAEFSPDNTKLYTLHDAVGVAGSVVNQFDITLPTTTAIAASQHEAYTSGSNTLSAMRLGPDGKIYLNRLSDLTSGYLDVINSPNLRYDSCNYMPHALALAGSSHGFLGLPALYIKPGGIAFYNNIDTFVCMHAGDTLNVYPSDTTETLLWYDGSAGHSHVVGGYGDYWVIGGDGCNQNMDTIHVRPMLADTVYTHVDTFFCLQSDLDTVQFSIPGGFDYTWNDGDTGSTHTIRTGGEYWVSYVRDCTLHIDTLSVAFAIYAPILGADTICTGSATVLSAGATGGVWSSGNAAIASIDATSGYVSGLAVGSATITYLMPPGCSETKNIVVVEGPCNNAVAPILTGPYEITIFPNPVNDRCTISISNTAMAAGSVSILDLSGRLIRSFPLTGATTTISTADLAPGMYQCVIAADNMQAACRRLTVIR